ncbi:GNAT family N-acetyltransferase [Tissierella sp.]|uniref:GNAT family N-acetyltransferase n=1 Tax=Tissierella sp. TaxID=41274 RepID=UPI002865BEE1|nr:GNAT family N-acetyltransferase [Tissierella sp.]MDR7857867.1 GNAT family N-acetyltransferase [Tissierella sp.]
MYERWSQDIRRYNLHDGYTIEKATGKEFSVYFAVYEIFESNIWFRQSFNVYCSVIEDCDICYWIKKDGNRIGGVLLEPNYMNCLFLEPPYNNEFDIVISKLKNILLCWSDKSEEIIVGGVKSDKIKYYQRAGFRMGESRRCMIRPTEEFEITWSDEYKIVSATKEHKDEICELIVEAFETGIDSRNDSEIKNQLQYYFDKNPEDSLVNRASTLIYEAKTNQLIGACLISIWEEWPNVFDIAVKPSFQKKGLAKNMIKQALTILKEQYPVLRLFVTLGNDAESLYHKMGFLAGVETTEMIVI